MSTADAFLARVQMPPVWGGCWIWGGKTGKGYGMYRRTGAHRYAYRLAFGEIPAGLVIDHRCEVTRCVNPLHLKATTQRDNILRSAKTMPNVNAAKDFCPRRHEYTPANTYVRGDGRRECRTCRTEFGRGWRSKPKRPQVAA